MAANVLEKIVRSTRERLEETKRARPEAEVQRAAEQAPAPRDFFAAIAAPGPIKLIAEIKKASPSQGVIRADFDPVAIARTYAAHGAACLSVLTDAPFFQGSLDYLRAVRAAVDLPLLRKDFILERYQVLEARAAGADAVLLIAECLDDCHLRSLHNLAVEWGMTPLVELYEPQNLPRVLEAGAALVGINNRDLRTFAVDLNHCMRLRKQIPADICVVGESGIETHAEAAALEAAGIDAMLVGGSLMAQADLGAAVDALLGRTFGGQDAAAAPE